MKLERILFGSLIGGALAFGAMNYAKADGNPKNLSADSQTDEIPPLPELSVESIDDGKTDAEIKLLNPDSCKGKDWKSMDESERARCISASIKEGLKGTPEEESEKKSADLVSAPHSKGENKSAGKKTAYDIADAAKINNSADGGCNKDAGNLMDSGFKSDAGISRNNIPLESKIDGGLDGGMPYDAGNSMDIGLAPVPEKSESKGQKPLDAKPLDAYHLRLRHGSKKNKTSVPIIVSDGSHGYVQITPGTYVFYLDHKSDRFRFTGCKGLQVQCDKIQVKSIAGKKGISEAVFSVRKDGEYSCAAKTKVEVPQEGKGTKKPKLTNDEDIMRLMVVSESKPSKEVKPVDKTPKETPVETADAGDSKDGGVADKADAGQEADGGVANIPVGSADAGDSKDGDAADKADAGQEADGGVANIPAKSADAGDSKDGGVADKADAGQKADGGVADAGICPLTGIEIEAEERTRPLINITGIAGIESVDSKIKISKENVVENSGNRIYVAVMPALQGKNAIGALLLGYNYTDLNQITVNNERLNSRNLGTSNEFNGQVILLAGPQLRNATELANTYAKLRAGVKLGSQELQYLEEAFKQSQIGFNGDVELFMPGLYRFGKLKIGASIDFGLEGISSEQKGPAGISNPETAYNFRGSPALVLDLGKNVRIMPGYEVGYSGKTQPGVTSALTHTATASLDSRISRFILGVNGSVPIGEYGELGAGVNVGYGPIFVQFYGARDASESNVGTKTTDTRAGVRVTIARDLDQAIAGKKRK